MLTEYFPLFKPVDFKMIYECKKYLQNNNIANRGRFDGDKKKQLIGLVGEVETHKLLKGFYPDLNDKEGGFDGGYDLIHNEEKIDVKTMSRQVFTEPHYANNFVKLQKNFKPDILLFNSINKVSKTIEFCGWIYKKELESKAILYKKGSVRRRGRNDTMTVLEDNYEILCKDLRNIRELL